MLKVKTTLINAEDENNKGHAEGKEYIKTPLVLIRCKTKGQY